jgi:hypothetical protein
VDALQSTLKLDCDGSDQKINLDKSTIFFGNKCELEVKNRVMATLGVHNEALQETYLRMPTDVGHAPTGTLVFFLTERENGRMFGRINHLRV